MFEFLVYLVTIGSIYSILTLSQNLVFGATGLVCYAIAAFYAIGAYSAAFLGVHEFPAYVGFLVAGGLSCVFALLIAIPNRRLTQNYWAIVSLAAAEVLRIVIHNSPRAIGGADGIRGIPRIFLGIFPPAQYDLFLAVFLVLFVAGVFGFVEILRKSAFGRTLNIIREDELLASSMGRNVHRYQTTALVLGGMIASTAGVFYAHYITYISPTAFEPIITILVWVMVITGGRGNNTGAIFGAILIESLYVSTRFLPSFMIEAAGATLGAFRLFVIGCVLTVFVIWRPKGIIEERRRSYRPVHPKVEVDVD